MGGLWLQASPYHPQRARRIPPPVCTRHTHSHAPFPAPTPLGTPPAPEPPPLPRRAGRSPRAAKAWSNRDLRRQPICTGVSTRAVGAQANPRPPAAGHWAAATKQAKATYKAGGAPCTGPVCPPDSAWSGPFFSSLTISLTVKFSIGVRLISSATKARMASCVGGTVSSGAAAGSCATAGSSTAAVVSSRCTSAIALQRAILESIPEGGTH